MRYGTGAYDITVAKIHELNKHWIIKLHQACIAVFLKGQTVFLSFFSTSCNMDFFPRGVSRHLGGIKLKVSYYCFFLFTAFSERLSLFALSPLISFLFMNHSFRRRPVISSSLPHIAIPSVRNAYRKTPTEGWTLIWKVIHERPCSSPVAGGDVYLST